MPLTLHYFAQATLEGHRGGGLPAYRGIKGLSLGCVGKEGPGAGPE